MTAPAPSSVSAPDVVTTSRGRLARFWAFWVELFDRKEPGTTLACFRISVGLVIVLTLLLVIDKDVVDVIWVEPKDGGYRYLGKGGPWLVKLLGGASPGVSWGLVWASIVSGTLLTFGLGGRVTAFVALQCYLNLHRINGESSGSSDILITNALWLLVLARSTATLSLDCRIRTGKWTSDERISSFPRYLAILQMVILYCTTGIQKVSVYWTPFGGFSALYYILQQPTWPRFDHSWAAWLYPLTQIGTATTWIWEITSPIILLIFWYRVTPERGGRLRYWANLVDLRMVWAAIGLTMHGFILLFMVVGPFSPISMAYYWNLWRPEEVRGVGRRIGLKLGLVRRWPSP